MASVCGSYYTPGLGNRLTHLLATLISPPTCTGSKYGLYYYHLTVAVIIHEALSRYYGGEVHAIQYP